MKHEQLIAALSSSGLADKGKPDYQKISEITGLAMRSVRSMLAPGKEVPRWVRLVVYVAENQVKPKSWADEFKPWQGKAEERDLLGDLTNVLPGDWVVNSDGEIIQIGTDLRTDIQTWVRFATKEEVLAHFMTQSAGADRVADLAFNIAREWNK